MLQAKRQLSQIVAVVSLFLGVGAIAQRSPPPDEANIALEKSIVTEHEPVILDIRFQSPPSTSLDFDPGYDWRNVWVKVVDPSGHAWERSPEVPQEGMKFSNAVHVDAGTERTISVVADEWFSFGEQGLYQIDVVLRGFPSRVSAKLSLRVEPRDNDALKAACSGLLARVNGSESFASSLVAAKALSIVKDPVAIPYLAEAMKRREFVSLMIGALAQLKTNDAVDALIEASKSSDPETRGMALSALVSLHRVNER